MSTNIHTQLLLFTALAWSLCSSAMALPSDGSERSGVKPSLQGTIKNDFVQRNLFAGQETDSIDLGSGVSTDDLQKMAQSSLAQHQLEQAKQILATIIERSPYNQSAFAKLGEISLKTGKPEDALPFLCIAHNLDTHDKKCLAEISLAEILIKSRHPSYHIADYFRNQSDVRSIVNQGVRLWGMGCPEQAAYLFKYAASIDPSNINAYFDLGVISEWKGDLPQALSYYEKSSSLIRDLSPSVATGSKSRIGAYIVNGRRVRDLSGAEDSFDLSADIARAEDEVRKKISGNGASASSPTFSLTVRSDIDTCDRCRIVRNKKMGPN